MIIDGVNVSYSGFVPFKGELENYVAYVKERVPDVDTIQVLANGDDVDIHWSARGQKFERLRRITGYLVSTLDKWNDAKQAEEHDRVKHDGIGKGIGGIKC